MSFHKITTTINGATFHDEVESRLSLVDYLRHRRHLTGTHVGCEHGVCGMCTILFDGQPVKSCLLLAVQADQHELRTVESLSVGEQQELHPLQAAFRAHHALQCGFCTPAFLMTVIALAESQIDCSDETVLREELAGVICRCTGYVGIVAAAAEYLNAFQGVEQ